MPKNSIATKASVLLAVLLLAQSAFANPAGTVTGVSGLLLVKSPTGSVKVLGENSALEQGQTLVTRPDTYAQVSLGANAVLTLGPDTELILGGRSAEVDARPPSRTLTLVHGRLSLGRKTSSGGAASEGAAEGLTVVTPAGVVDTRGASVILGYVPGAADGNEGRRADAVNGREDRSLDARMMRPLLLSSVGDSARRRGLRPVSLQYTGIQLAQAANPIAPVGGLQPGLYVQVLDGMINVSGGGGTANFAAGQFGFTPSFHQPPVILPQNPGIQFTPPPTFSSVGGVTNTKEPAAATNAVDCIVR